MAVIVWLTLLFGFAPASATVMPARVVSFHGYRLSVPAGWPVYDLAREPSECVRFDRHAVYLGTPSPRQRCPAHAVGRTEAILLSPLRAGEAAAVRGGGGAGIGVMPSGGSATSFIVRSAGLAVTATWSTNPGLLSTILRHRVTAPAAGGDARPSVASPRAADAAAHAAVANAAAAQLPRAHAAGIFDGLGFDACSAPSATAMSDWLASPYRAVGVYIGGVNSSCAQPNLNATWVAGEIGGGWQLIPTYVGYQGAGACGGTCATITPSDASAEGTSDASAAVGDAQALGIPAGSPIYDDMEQFRSSAADNAAVLAYLQAWTTQLHAEGYVSGVYGSASSAITDLVDEVGTGYVEPDDIWIADWDGQQTTSDSYVPARDWSGEERLRQYQGGHDETWGGVTLNIDSDDIGGATAGNSAQLSDGTFVQVSGSIYVYRIVGGAPTYVSSWAAFGGPQPVETISQAQFNALPQYPADGTFVQTAAGTIYRMAGGAPILVSSWSVFGAPQTTELIDPWDLENTSNCLAHVLAAPADGTVVEGLPSDTYWLFASGQRSLVTTSPDAVQVDDIGLESFPLASPTGGGGPVTASACPITPVTDPTPATTTTTTTTTTSAPPPPVKVCVVPKLKHLTLTSARAALTRANCRVGTVRKPRHVARRHVLHVFGQSAAPKSTHPDGDRINLLLL